MNTRFDMKTWVTAFGEVIPVTELETAHAMNILRMFITKPDRTMAMLLTDIERESCHGGVWCPNGPSAKAQSIRNATSLTAQELQDYALGSTLGKALVTELESRGVNVENILNLYTADTARN